MNPPVSRRQLLVSSSAALAAAGTAASGDGTRNILALLLTAPAPADVPLFCAFIRQALPAEGVNTLVVRFRYCYHFQSHSELDHLAGKGCRMGMWSDQLIDGKTTNLLGWQASMNNTHRAIDAIPKDVMICDWKYETAPPTPAYFAVKGFDVLTCPCANMDAALAQLEQVYLLRKDAARADFAKPLASRMKGVLATSWMSSASFIHGYYAQPDDDRAAALARANAETLKALFAQIRKTAGA